MVCAYQLCDLVRGLLCLLALVLRLYTGMIRCLSCRLAAQSIQNSVWHTAITGMPVTSFPPPSPQLFIDSILQDSGAPASLSKYLNTYAYFSVCLFFFFMKCSTIGLCKLITLFSHLFQCGMNSLVGKVFLRTNLEAGISVVNFIFKLVAFTTSRVLTWPMTYGSLYYGLFSFLDQNFSGQKQSNILFIIMPPGVVVVVVLVARLCLQDPMDCSSLVSPSMGFPKQEYWTGLPFPSPGDPPDRNQTWDSCIACRFFTTQLPGKPLFSLTNSIFLSRHGVEFSEA